MVFIAVHRLSLVAASEGYSLVAVLSLLIVMDLCLAEHGFWASKLQKLWLTVSRARSLFFFHHSSQLKFEHF